MTDSLFEPFTMGDMVLPNRIVMAPLTRNRATHDTLAPNAMSTEYYAQRATAGLIISEATQISQQGQGYAWTPGIYSERQMMGWEDVTAAVHRAHGRIFCQLWHVGRISHVSLQAGGAAPVAPSAIQAKGKTFIETGFAEVSMPRALAIEEIPGIMDDYAHAALLARKSGFDGVELHAANGYLIDQFMKDGTNHRSDAYGGSVANRARFGLEAVDALLRELPPARVGVRISPVSPANDALTSDPQQVFGYFVDELSRRGVAYLHVVEGATGGPRDIAPFDYAAIRRAFRGAYMANNGYTREMATEALALDRADLIAFGRPFIANPDLVARLRVNSALSALNQKTLYGGGAEGYTDYPPMQAAAAE